MNFARSLFSWANEPNCILSPSRKRPIRAIRGQTVAPNLALRKHVWSADSWLLARCQGIDEASKHKQRSGGWLGNDRNVKNCFQTARTCTASKRVDVAGKGG